MTGSWIVWYGFVLAAVACSFATAAHNDDLAGGALSIIQAQGASTQSVEAASVEDSFGIRSEKAEVCAFSTRATQARACVQRTRRQSLLISKFTPLCWGLLEVSKFLEHMAEVRSWVTETVSVVVEGNFTLDRAAKRADSLHPCGQDISDTGAGFLINDAALWSRGSDTAQRTAAQVAKRWKTLPRVSVRGKPKPNPLVGGFAQFETTVAKMILEFLAVLTDVPRQLLWQLCATLAVSSFFSLQSLERAEMGDVQEYIKAPALRALLRRAIAHANSEAERRDRRLEKKRHFEELAVPGSVPVASAEEAAASFSKTALLDADEKVEAALADAALDGASAEAPGQCIAAWAQAKAEGHDVFSLLRLKKRQLLAEPLRRNGAAIASGCRKWHAFAVFVLGYLQAATLPPACGEHVVFFVLMFRCGATAANYVNHIVSACKALGLSTAWHTEEVQNAKVVARARSLRLVLPGYEALVLTWIHVQSLVLFCDSVGSPGRGTLYLVFWEFLLRVQSEGVGLEWGSPDEIARLPPSRHSALFVHNLVAGLRLARRKHRAQGSFLQRPCTCSVHGPKFCVVHRLLAWTMVKGERVSVRSSYEVQKEFREDCASCGLPGAQRRTLKSFRAGKATAMAARGDSLAAILECGEWRSCALLKYISETEVDKQQFLRNAFAEDDIDEE